MTDMQALELHFIYKHQDIRTMHAYTSKGITNVRNKTSQHATQTMILPDKCKKLAIMITKLGHPNVTLNHILQAKAEIEHIKTRIILGS